MGKVRIRVRNKVGEEYNVVLVLELVMKNQAAVLLELIARTINVRWIEVLIKLKSYG